MHQRSLRGGADRFVANREERLGERARAVAQQEEAARVEEAPVAVVQEPGAVVLVLEQVQAAMVDHQVQVETAGLQMVVVQEIVLLHHPLIPRLHL